MARTLANTLTPEQILQLEHKAWRLRMLAHTQDEIAEALLATEGFEVDRSTVSRTLARIKRRLDKKFEAEDEEVKREHLARLDFIYREAMAQWVRSCEDAVTDKIAVKQGPWEPATGDDLPPSAYEKPSNLDDEGLFVLERSLAHEEKGQTGNPALLAQAREALADMRKIRGLDARLKLDVTSKDEALQVRFYIPDNGRDTPADATAAPGDPTATGSPGDLPGDAG